MLHACGDYHGASIERLSVAYNRLIELDILASSIVHRTAGYASNKTQIHSQIYCVYVRMYVCM